jgi:hypothetical protein
MGSMEPPDDVQDILDQERFEESGEYEQIVRDWMASDDGIYDEARARFPLTAEYDTAFDKWRAA